MSYSHFKICQSVLYTELLSRNKILKYIQNLQLVMQNSKKKKYITKNYSSLIYFFLFNYLALSLFIEN